MENNRTSFFTKKIKILIVIAVLLSLLVPAFIFIYTRSSSMPQETNEQGAPKQFPERLSSIYFENPSILAETSVPASVNILVNTGGEEVSSAIISVKFNPASVTNVSIEQFRDPSSALANTFENSAGNVDENEGIAWITLNFPENVPPQAGAGAVARLTFTPNSNTILTFSENSALVSSLSVSPLVPNFSSLKVTVTNSLNSQEYIPQ